MLSQDNLSYASTCQTIGLNTGYFASFTVFLALNSESFSYVPVPVTGVPGIDGWADRRLKWGIPRLMLSTYMQFCAALSFFVTVWLLFVKEVLCHTPVSVICMRDETIL